MVQTQNTPTFAEQTTQAKHAINGSIRQKKTPPKAGFLGFYKGVLPSFHSVKKSSSQNHLVFRRALCKGSSTLNQVSQNWLLSVASHSLLQLNEPHNDHERDDHAHCQACSREITAYPFSTCCCPTFLSSMKSSATVRP